MANEDSITVEILLDCVKRGGNHGNKHQSSISMVPSILRERSPTSFNPRVVSIGPLHRRDQNLQQLKGLKESYLHDLLHTLDCPPEETLTSCVQKVNASIQQIRASYAGAAESYTNVDLAMMVVMDGCFILEFCSRQCSDHKLYLPNQTQNALIAKDLFLIENQIPFFVLELIFDCTLRNLTTPSLANLLYKVLLIYLHPFLHRLPANLPVRDDFATDSIHDHVLGFWHKCYELADAETSKHAVPETPRRKLKYHPAVDLDKSGVIFKPHNMEKWTMAMNIESSLFSCFPLSCRNPTLRMPILVIDDSTELVLRNFMAYEQITLQVHHYFTTYAGVMDILIDFQEDVYKLVESEVLVNNLGSNEAVANLINGLVKNSSSSDYCHTQELRQLDSYYNSYWQRLRRTYFSSPWNAINLFAGFILFSLTIVQTVIAITDR